MTVFSKLLITEKSTFVPLINMSFLHELYQNNFTIPAVGTLIICVVTYYLMKCLSNDAIVPVPDHNKNHNWKPIKITAKAWYCSICEALLLNGIGVYCDCCGICSDAECMRKANAILLCKEATSNNEVQLHHWVKGNLPLGAVCTVCNEECALEPGLVDFQCCWCQRSVHEECENKVEKICDFGNFRNMIVPPWCVQVARYKRSLRRHLLLRGVKDPGWENWSPLIVIANRKSGNKDGDAMLSEFRKYLNPVQVIDLAERKPTAALQWCILLPNKQLRILVGGGDGTVAWVLSTAYKLDLDPEPAVAIMPLGTGNDLSRVLDWGKENDPEFDVEETLSDIQKAKIVPLDRWKIEINATRHLGIRIPNKTLYMYNYLSLGVDAQVALSFHRTRESMTFSNRIFNKILYVCFGTQQVVSADCKNLEQSLDLFLDGQKIDLPEMEAVVVANISSWAAGVDLWSLCGNDKRHQSHSDGVLEVFAIYSSFHMAQLQMGLSAPKTLGQASVVEIRLKSKIPMQVDGEPWEQPAGVVKVTLTSKATVLSNKTRKSSD